MADPKAPYGNVTYADPGYQSDKVKRYPLDSEEHVRAAWSYINQAKNAGKYNSSQLASIKSKIRHAMEKYGIKEGDGSSSSSSMSRSAAITWVEEPYGPDGVVLVAVGDREAVLQSGEKVIPSPTLFGAGFITRSLPLDDIQVSAGDGRTVTAYAAAFNVETEIWDAEGHYKEVIDPSAFGRALQRANAGDGNWKVGVFYNHAKTMGGTPSERGSMTLGKPIDIRTDNHGVLTVTRYNRTSLADDVLEMIKNGDVTGQSFTGPIIKSDPGLTHAQRRRGGYQPDSSGQLKIVRRMELGFLEYGPTPIPAYEEAAIIGVRARLLAEAQSDEDQGNAPDESVDPLHRRLTAAMRSRGF